MFLPVIPFWAWVTGGAVVVGATTAVVIDQTGDTAEQMGDAAVKTAEPMKWLVAAGALYVTYRVAKSTGVIK